MAETVTALPDKRLLLGDGWSLRTERLDFLDGNDWRALIGVRRDLKLLVTWNDQAKEADIEAWAGEPEQTDGIAVVDTGSGDFRLARIPLCSCGTRGCNHFGIQFAKWLPGDKLPALVEQLREFPWTRTIPTRANVLQGDNLAAIDDPDTGQSPDGTSYLYAPGTGQTFPLRSKDSG